MTKIKHLREIRVGILVVVAVFVLYFGLNFLKGTNIFSPTRYYYGTFENLSGLKTSADVYIEGYKVGQVTDVVYDFNRIPSFVVEIAIDKAIRLPQQTKMVLFADGIIGGMAIRLERPAEIGDAFYQPLDTLPTSTYPGLVEQLSSGLLAQLSDALTSMDSLVTMLNTQLQGDYIKNSLANVERISSDLRVSSAQLKQVMNNDLPPIVADAKQTMADLKTVSSGLTDIDFRQIALRVDTTVTNLQHLSTALSSTDGTLGMLLNDKQLYVSLNQTVTSADNLLVDLRQNPKRYVQFSLWGKKEK